MPRNSVVALAWPYLEPESPRAAERKSPVQSPQSPNQPCLLQATRIKHSVRLGEDSPLTGVSMMAIWATTVLHRGAPPSFSGGYETPDFKGLLRWPVTVAEGRFPPSFETFSNGD